MESYATLARVDVRGAAGAQRAAGAGTEMADDWGSAERLIQEATRFLQRAARQLMTWFDRLFQEPQIVWIDRSDEPRRPHGREGVADYVTGQLIRDTDRVCVCSRCDVTYLLATWKDVTKMQGDVCVACRGRGTVHEI